MNKNPYTEFLKIVTGVAENNQSPTISLGTIVAPPPNIQVSYNGILLETPECLISEYLLSGYTRHVVGSTSDAAGGSGDAEYASHRHPVNNDETWTDTLKPGDKVVIMPCPSSDDRTKQLYIILDKVVKPDRSYFE